MSVARFYRFTVNGFFLFKRGKQVEQTNIQSTSKIWKVFVLDAVGLPFHLCDPLTPNIKTF